MGEVYCCRSVFSGSIERIVLFFMFGFCSFVERFVFLGVVLGGGDGFFFVGGKEIEV